MGKKRRLLSSKKKFGAKHSNHPRMKMIMAGTTTETNVVPPTITKTVEPPTPPAPPKEVAPVINEVPEFKTETIEEKPPVTTTVPTTKATIKAKPVTTAPKKTTANKKVTTRKTSRKTVKKKANEAST